MFGFVGVFGMTTAVLVLGACVVVFFGIETRNRSLEDIESKELGEPRDMHGLQHSTELRG